MSTDLCYNGHMQVKLQIMVRSVSGGRQAKLRSAVETMPGMWHTLEMDWSVPTTGDLEESINAFIADVRKLAGVSSDSIEIVDPENLLDRERISA